MVIQVVMPSMLFEDHFRDCTPRSRSSTLFPESGNSLATDQELGLSSEYEEKRRLGVHFRKYP